MAIADTSNLNIQTTYETEVTERSSGRRVMAQVVVDLTLEQIEQTEKHWALAREEANKQWGRSNGFRPEDLHWNWYRKRMHILPDEARVFGLRVDGDFEGLIMLSNTPVKSRRPQASHQNMLYVEYLETAPRNQKIYVGEQAVYRGVGTGLLLSAIGASTEMGLGGRLALHSLSTAETFYVAQGFVDLGFDKKEYHQYYELTDDGVKNLIGDVDEDTEAKR